MKDKFLIGELARIFNTTTETLRHYDKMNLLNPEKNADNNYRYYDIGSMFKLSRILFLKTLGISLSDIEDYMNNKKADRLLFMLKKKNQDLEMEIQKLTNLKHKIDSKLELFEHAKTKLGKITVETIDQRQGIFLKTIGVDDSQELKEIFKRNENYLKFSSWLVEGQVFTSLPKEDMENGVFNQFRYFIEVNPLDSQAPTAPIILPKNDYACMTVIGPYTDLVKHYKTLVDWIDTSGYSIVGDSIENNIVDSDYSDSADEFITELQIPIRRVN